MRISDEFIDFCLSEINSQHSMLAFYKKNTALLNKKCQEILPSTKLEYLVIQNSLVSGVYMDDIFGMEYQLHHLHFRKYFIQQQHDVSGRHLC